MNGVPLVPTTSGQCFLLTNDDLLGITSGNFWAHNLYMRAALPNDTEREYHFPALAVVPPQATTSTAAVFLTNMIFQGDGEGSTVAIGADDKVFVSGSHHIWIRFKGTLQASENPKNVPSGGERSEVCDSDCLYATCRLLLECVSRIRCAFWASQFSRDESNHIRAPDAKQQINQHSRLL
jgi:hypothetical protein